MGCGVEVTRRESNCLSALKVLEMICDLFRECVLEGGRGGVGGGARDIVCERSERERERARERNDLCKCPFPVAAGSCLSTARKCGVERKVE